MDNRIPFNAPTPNSARFNDTDTLVFLTVEAAGFCLVGLNQRHQQAAGGGGVDKDIAAGLKRICPALIG